MREGFAATVRIEGKSRKCFPTNFEGVTEIFKENTDMMKVISSIPP